MKLPTGWVETTCGSVIKRIEAGKSFKCEERRPKPGEIGVLKVSAISWGDYDELESKTCLDEDRIDPTLLVRSGDFLFSRANTIELVGACVIARQVTRQSMLSDKTLRISFSGVRPEWIMYALRSALGRREIERLASGNQESMRNIGQDRILQIQIPVAPRREQNRIVAAIEEQLSRVDAGVGALERVKKELARYRASVLKTACEGRLVPTEAALARTEGRDYESASELLARILARRRARWDRKKKYAEPAVAETSSLPVLPEGWVYASMDQLLESLRNGVSTVPNEATGVSILRISAVRALRVDLEDRRFLPGGPENYQGDELRTGDLLFTRYNGSRGLVGVCACSPNPSGFIVYPDKIIRGRVDRSLISGSFVAIAANVGSSRAHIEARIRTTAGQAGVSGGDIKSMPVPLPPLSEQHRIVAEVERRLSIADEVAATVDSALARAMRLRQSILKRAFEGRLVLQDPNDEPASVLLERIRAERAQEAVAMRARGRRSRS